MTEIGVLDLRGLGEALGRERVRHTMGIVDVHLAAERLDMNFARSVHADLNVMPALVAGIHVLKPQ